MAPEQAVVECKEESGSRGSSPHRKHTSFAPGHGWPEDGVIHGTRASCCRMQKSVRLGWNLAPPQAHVVCLRSRM